jgi:hypothetical protein
MATSGPKTSKLKTSSRRCTSGGARKLKQVRPRGMSRLVVDTDVVSFLFKHHPSAKLYDSELLGHALMLSFMTVAELGRWVILRRWGEARRTWLKKG